MKRVHTTLTETYGETNRCTDDLLEDYGDKIGRKEEGHIRIAFQNINGIKGRINAAHEVFTTVEEKDMDILGIAETNINWTDAKRLEMNVAMRMRFGQEQMVASSSKASKEGYLPGGTAMIMQGRVTVRIIKKGMDEMGRFTWMILKGKN